MHHINKNSCRICWLRGYKKFQKSIMKRTANATLNLKHVIYKKNHINFVSLEKDKRVTFWSRITFSVGNVNRTFRMAQMLLLWRRRILLQGLLLLSCRIRRHVGQPELPDQLTVTALRHVQAVHVQEAVLGGQKDSKGLLDAVGDVSKANYLRLRFKYIRSCLMWSIWAIPKVVNDINSYRCFSISCLK